MRHAICVCLLLTAVAGCDDPDERAPDAARPDASSPDAATPDARSPDAAALDASAPDASPDASPDAATPDAAPPDAAPECPTPGPEVCNGIDDDCDDTVDEAIEPTPCQTGQPGVCAAGTTACVDGAAACAPATAPGEERCDGLDNDCDGTADEEVAPPEGIAFEERGYRIEGGCNSIMLVDLNADGALDIVCGGGGVGDIRMLVNDGGGDFAAPVALDAVGGIGQVHAAADIDLDGTVDLIVKSAGRGAVIRDPLGDTPETVAMPETLELPDGEVLPIRLLDLAVADLNGDGAPDIAFGAHQGQRFFLAWSANQGDGVFGPVRAIAELPVGMNEGAVSAHDVDGDGFIDLLVNWYPELYFARGGPEGPVDGVVPLAPGPVNGIPGGHNPPQRVADVTGDGVLDVVTTAALPDRQYALWRASIGPGPALGDRVSFVLQADFIRGIGLTQLDCDPEPEVLAEVIQPGGRRPIHAFPDASTLRDPFVVLAHDDAFGLAIGDVDGDGLDDIVQATFNMSVRVSRRVP